LELADEEDSKNLSPFAVQNSGKPQI